ncbi:MAG: sigma-70 family RNA polymerase sigma factor [Sulfurifustis sp.]
MKWLPREADNRVSTISQPGAAGELALPHLDAAYNLARWLLKSDQDAADAVHDAFLRAAGNMHTYRGDNGRSWWLAIVRNCCFAIMKARKRAPQALDAVETGDDASLPHTEAAALEDNLHAAQCATRIAQHLERLPPEFREVVVLREMEDCSYREIADILDVPIGTVMSRLARARTLLKRALADCFDRIDNGM